MDKIKQFVEDHPIATAVGVFVIGVIIIYSFSGGSSTTAANTSYNPGAADQAYYNAEAAAMQAGDQLQGQQLQLQAHANDTQASLAAVTVNDQTQAQIAQIQANAQTGDMTLQAQTAQLYNAEQAQTQQLISTLTAGVQTAQFNDELQSNLAGIQAQVQMNANNNATTAALQQMNTQLAEYNAYWNAATAWNTGVVNENITYMNDQTFEALAHPGTAAPPAFDLHNAAPVGATPPINTIAPPPVATNTVLSPANNYQLENLLGPILNQAGITSVTYSGPTAPSTTQAQPVQNSGGGVSTDWSSPPTTGANRKAAAKASV